MLSQWGSMLASRGVLAGASTRAMFSSRALIFERFGDPDQVLEYRECPAGHPGPGQVLLELIAAPINPSDINTIQGRYPLQPDLPGVPGHEGVLRVVEAGDGVAHLAPGDAVVPLAPALGTWRTRGVFAAELWHKVPPELPPATAATMCINPPTALCMLRDIVSLEPGDVVVQNGATSCVGQAVIQLARAQGLRTVNVVRERPDWDATVGWLNDLGADLVTTEERLKRDLAISGLPPPALGLNCVGGTCATAVAKTLREGGTLVTYGAMSLQPLTVPAGLLIFRDLHFVGFWLSGGWARRAGGAPARAALLDEVAALYARGALRPPRAAAFEMSSFREALSATREAFRPAKALLVPEGSALLKGGSGDAAAAPTAAE